MPYSLADVRRPVYGDEERVLYHSTPEGMKAWLDKGEAPPAMESAGPRRTLFFDPAKLACGS